MSADGPELAGPRAPVVGHELRAPLTSIEG